MQDTFKLLINGQLVDGASTQDVINPATEQVLAQCPLADEAQLEAAVAAAKAAYPAWAARPYAERQALVFKLADALQARAQEFAELLTAEQGKPLDQAFMEVMGSAGTLRALGSIEVKPRLVRETDDHKVVEHRGPLGVVAAITPWNFPLILLMTKAAPALVTGNTMVAKPAPTTPLTTLLFGEIAAEILPAGVLNLIAADNDVAARLTRHPDIAKIAFTGSTGTGRKVMAAAAESVKRVTLELGGNDAAIVLDDVDAKTAAKRLYNGAMANAGQICVAVKRAYVPSSMYDAVCDELVELAGQSVVDDGTRQGAQIGPVQNRMQFERVLELIEDAKVNGKVIAGGEPLDRPGYFIPPTIVRDVEDSTRIVCEEQFGPVLPVLRYDDIDDVIARANASEYGLAGTVWSNDIERATEIAMRIETGTVWVNHHLAIDPMIPFRGSKQSGLGGEMAEEGVHEYTQAKIVNVAKAPLA